MTRSDHDPGLQRIYERSVHRSEPSDRLYRHTRDALRSRGVLHQPITRRWNWPMAIAALLAGILLGRLSVARPGSRATPEAQVADLTTQLEQVQQRGSDYAEALYHLASQDQGIGMDQLRRAQEIALALHRAIQTGEYGLGLDRRPTMVPAPPTQQSDSRPQVWF